MSYMLSTIDNPYNPFTEWENWFAFDSARGYHSSEYLGRIAKTSYGLSDELNEKEIERAIDEIVKYNAGFYVKIGKETGLDDLKGRSEEEKR